MAIATDAERKVLANAYVADAPFGDLFTADPGTTGTVTGEVTGGAPAYARKNMTWGAATTSGSTAVCTSAATPFDVGSGNTITFFGVCHLGVLATSDLRDKVSVTSQAFASQGTYTVTATFTQS